MHDIRSGQPSFLPDTRQKKEVRENPEVTPQQTCIPNRVSTTGKSKNAVPENQGFKM